MPVPVRRLMLSLVLGATLLAGSAFVARAQTTCESAYDPSLCIASAWEIGDLDCPNIGAVNFPVAAPDSHGFDGDYDGIGCEA